MEPIKDLDLLINEGEKIARFAKLFARLPEILQALNTAEGHLKEINKAIAAENKELDNVRSKVAFGKKTLAGVSDKLTAAEKAVQDAEAASKAKIAEINKKENYELEKIRKANNDAVENSIRLMKHEMEIHQKALKKADEDHRMKLRVYQDSIEGWKKLEQEAVARVDKAKKQLADIAQRING